MGVCTYLGICLALKNREKNVCLYVIPVIEASWLLLHEINNLSHCRMFHELSRQLYVFPRCYPIFRDDFTIFNNVSRRVREFLRCLTKVVQCFTMFHDGYTMFQRHLRPGLDVEFHMRESNTYLSRFELKNAALDGFRRRILHVPNRIRERGKHRDGHNKVDFFSPDGKFVMKIGGN